MRMLRSIKSIAVVGICAVGFAATPASAIKLQFDYSRDANNFFDTQLKKDRLEQAAAAFVGFADTLSPIAQSGSNTWSALISNPASGANEFIPGLVVPSNTLIIYAGGRDLPAGVAGAGGPGGLSASGNQAWFDTILARGQSGALAPTPTDYGPWGGQISFDTVGTNWFFGSTTAGLTSPQTDFLSVAMHELGHLLGFGTADSFNTYISGSNFTGPASMAAHGGTAVPLYTLDFAHWAEGTLSNVGPVTQEADMDPSILNGTRKVFTSLDYAGMADIGWQIPEPGSATLMLVSAVGLLARRRRCRV
jgi:hypothetical protein